MVEWRGAQGSDVRAALGTDGTRKPTPTWRRDMDLEGVAINHRGERVRGTPADIVTREEATSGRRSEPGRVGGGCDFVVVYFVCLFEEKGIKRLRERRRMGVGRRGPVPPGHHGAVDSPMGGRHRTPGPDTQ